MYHVRAFARESEGESGAAPRCACAPRVVCACRPLCSVAELPDSSACAAAPLSLPHPRRCATHQPPCPSSYASSTSHLGLWRRRVEDRLQLHRHRHRPGDLELAHQERLLRVELAHDELHKVGVRDGQRQVGPLAVGGAALAERAAAAAQVERPLVAVDVKDDEALLSVERCWWGLGNRVRRV